MFILVAELSRRRRTCPFLTTHSLPPADGNDRRMNRQIRLRTVRRPEAGAGDVRQRGVVSCRHLRDAVHGLGTIGSCREGSCRCCKGPNPFSGSSSNRRYSRRAPVVRLVSIAYWSHAESIIRRSFRMRLACERLRARRNPGTAIAASNAMIATTIMISTRVKPPRRLLMAFNMLLLSLLFVGLTALRDILADRPLMSSVNAKSGAF